MKSMAVLVSLLVATNVMAADVKLLGAYGNQASVMIDGKGPFVLREGYSSIMGVRAVSVRNGTVQIDNQGAVQSYDLGDGRPITKTIATGNGEAVLKVAPNGLIEGSFHFNGIPLNALVDTGATMVAISVKEAAAMKLTIPDKSPEMTVQTASGRERAVQVVLNEVRIGEVSVREVEAVVVYPKDDRGWSGPLIGMNFLKRVDWKMEGGNLVLKNPTSPSPVNNQQATKTTVPAK